MLFCGDVGGSVVHVGVVVLVVVVAVDAVVEASQLVLNE